MNETTDPRETEGAFWCPCCGRWQEPDERSFYPARTGPGDYYCRDCVAAEDAPPWIPPEGS